MTTLTTLENNWTIEQFIWSYCIVLYRIWSYCIVLFVRIALHHNWHQYGQWDSSINWMTVLLTLSQFEMFVLLSIADIKYSIVPGSSKKSLNLCLTIQLYQLWHSVAAMVHNCEHNWCHYGQFKSYCSIMVNKWKLYMFQLATCTNCNIAPRSINESV